MAGKVTVVLDSQAGSCGKGKFIGYLAQCDNIDVAINNFMSNAGHTYVDDTHGKVMTQHLPTSIVNPNANLYIGPGAAITPSILFNEVLNQGPPRWADDQGQSEGHGHQAGTC